VRKLFLFKGGRGREEEGNDDKTEKRWKTNAVDLMEMFILIKFDEKCKQFPAPLPVITKFLKLQVNSSAVD
jgi:hypothetical protein